MAPLMYSSVRLSNEKLSFADLIIEASIQAYNNLGKAGKPTPVEWTVLSAIVQYDHFNEDLEVVSLGTGSKCIGAREMDPLGHILNDSHAEVIARRGFLAYLYDNIKRAAAGENTIFRLENNKFKLEENIEYYLYSSHLPCGDSSIIPKETPGNPYPARFERSIRRNKKHKARSESDGDQKQIEYDSDFGSIVGSKRHSEENRSDNVKKQKLEFSDTFRTGAKCVPHAEQDKREPGVKYHALGQVRTKPGRGERTLSVSCSDKICRWLHIGIQGALLDMLLYEPIFLKAIIIGGGVLYSQEAIERALIKRNPASAVQFKCIPEILQGSLVFPHCEKNESIRMCSTSISWTKLKGNQGSEVANRGRRQGVVAKNLLSPQNALAVSKLGLYKTFLSVVRSFDKEVLKNTVGEDIENIPYNEMKKRSKAYIERWEFVKKEYFGTWTIKPDIFSFSVESE